jgi:hypothetical protein
MVPSAEINEVTRREWRELGFFYDCIDSAKEWRIVGSKEQLRRFGKILRDYVADSRNQVISEHEHYGPYMYLEVGTWTSAEITDHWIAGPLDKLLELAEAIESRIEKANVGDEIKLRDTFSPSSPYELVLEVKAESFDPALADPACW